VLYPPALTNGDYRHIVRQPAGLVDVSKPSDNPLYQISNASIQIVNRPDPYLEQLILQGINFL